MQIRSPWRDSFPKLGLDQQYIGDGLPLCSDLPNRHFLRTGATYVLLGSNPKPHFHLEPSDWAADVKVLRPKLDKENSALYKELCNSDGQRCQFRAKIVLSTDLECAGIECEIQAPRVVEVEEGIFYEYLRIPCAYQAFFNDGRVLKRQLWDPYSCGDPRQELGKS